MEAIGHGIEPKSFNDASNSVPARRSGDHFSQISLSDRDNPKVIFRNLTRLKNFRLGSPSDCSNDDKSLTTRNLANLDWLK